MSHFYGQGSGQHAERPQIGLGIADEDGERGLLCWAASGNENREIGLPVKAKGRPQRYKGRKF